MINIEKKKTETNYQIPPVHHIFDIKLATMLGSIELAILVNHFTFWIDLNARNDRNFHKGKYWTYQTIKEIASYFPYWSHKQVERYLKKLVDMKILEKANFNSNPYDRTIWYAFHEEFSTKYSHREIDIPKSGNGKLDNGNSTYPEIGKCIHTDNKTDNKTDKRGGKPPSTDVDSPARSNFSFNEIEREKNVSTTDEEHTKLVELYGKEETAKAYKVLSLWKMDTPRARWKKSDYRSIRRWVIDAVKEQRKKEKAPEKEEEKNSEIIEENKKWIREKMRGIEFDDSDIKITVGDACVGFKTNRGYFPIGYLEPDFKELVGKHLKYLENS